MNKRIKKKLRKRSYIKNWNNYRIYRISKMINQVPNSQKNLLMFVTPKSGNMKHAHVYLLTNVRPKIEEHDNRELTIKFSCHKPEREVDLLNNQIRGKEYISSLLSKRISGRMKKLANMTKTKENDNEGKERMRSGIKENTDCIDKFNQDK